MQCKDSQSNMQQARKPAASGGKGAGIRAVAGFYGVQSDCPGKNEL